MTSTSLESGARGRTRRAILSAAVHELSRRRGATLAEIAQSADVGRSTLQRYFPDRQALLAAVTEESTRVLGEAFEGARIAEGTPREALRRLVTAMVEAGDHVLFLYGDPHLAEELLAEGESDPATLRIRQLIERGQADGVLDPEVSCEWIEHLLWSVVFAGCSAVSAGHLPRHGAAASVVRSLENGICTAR